ncbi:MAG: glycosyltransferase family 2 protein [Dehalococcoidia bacterium]
MSEAVRFPGVTYILPIKQTEPDRGSDLDDYFAALGKKLELIAVDGSPDDVFEANDRRWQNVRHVAPSPELTVQNGKVRGVLTGLQLASNDHIIIADDDVRYDDESLSAIIGHLDNADVVRPQNYFEPRPWHALWDSGRSLLNRLQGGDWPGTLALRKQALANGYNGDVLFENLELVRTVQATGGCELLALDLFVRRRPPALSQFLNQRVRQAYDEFARPPRLLFQLSWLPLQLVLFRRGPAALLVLYAAVAGAAEVGRRRAGGDRVFPPLASAAAPLWFIERSVCAWVAVASRLLQGGVSYRGGVIAKAASSPAELRARLSPGEIEPA